MNAANVAPVKCPCSCGIDKPAMSGWEQKKTLLVVCAGCKRILGGDIDAEDISHGLCAPCVRRLYPDMADEILAQL